MKTLNKIAFITFAGLSLLMGIFAIIEKRIDLGCLCIICASIFYAAYEDFKNPEL